ncbi:MAG TPA: molybdopterin molybdotransferase MoeA [Halothiobacillus sp.]|nr:molybdopterin molybdotransferase MoeA [Halothiobacillus sp.]
MKTLSLPPQPPNPLTRVEPPLSAGNLSAPMDPCDSPDEHAVSLHTAIARLRASLNARPTVRLPLIQALNQRLATPLIAPNPFPPFHRAMMDGYAARFSDLCAKSPLDRAGESAAGSADLAPLAQGTVVAIATGAPLPQGADCVIRKEYARVEANKVFVTVELIRPSADCESCGSVARQGDVLIPAQTRLLPAHLAVAARHGVPELAVTRAYGIQILLIGNELAPAGQPRQQGQIYEHNQILIESVLAQHHVRVLPEEPIIPDDEHAIRTAVLKSLSTTPPPDLILLVGGTSAGNHDHTRAALAPLGVWLFHGLNLRPGRPTCALKTLQGIPLIALPGSPKSIAALLPGLIAPVLGF